MLIYAITAAGMEMTPSHFQNKYAKVNLGTEYLSDVVISLLLCFFSCCFAMTALVGFVFTGNPYACRS